MDPLSDVLRVISLDAGVFLDAQFTAPWAVVSKVEAGDLQAAPPRAAQVLAYHYIATGAPVLAVKGQAPIALRTGDIALLPRNDVHTIGSAVDVPPIDAGPLVTQPREGGLAQIRFGGGGAQTQLVCGYIVCEAGRHALIDALPPVLRFNVRDWEAGPWVETLFRHAALESAARRPGSDTSLAKVSELLFVEAVRRHLDDVAADRSGWLAALRDPAVGKALALLHERPADAWTVDVLADRVYLSRSAFAERFTALLGVAPLGYLTNWRMHLARRALRLGRSVAQVAAQVGYESEAAFSRAFKREVGCAPRTWRIRSTDSDRPRRPSRA